MDDILIDVLYSVVFMVVFYSVQSDDEVGGHVAELATKGVSSFTCHSGHCHTTGHLEKSWYFKVGLG